MYNIYDKLLLFNFYTINICIFQKEPDIPKETQKTKEPQTPSRNSNIESTNKVVSSPRTPKQGQQYQQQQQFQQQQFQQSFNCQLPPKTTPGGSAITVIDSDDDGDIIQLNPQLDASNSFSFNQVVYIIYKFFSFQQMLNSDSNYPPFTILFCLTLSLSVQGEDVV